MLTKRIKKLNLENYIKLHGFQNKEYINKKILNSSIYVLPSRSESFGIVLLEAFSYGLPCIAFDVEGAKELISNNWDGYLIKNFSKENMSKRICELIKNENRRIIMGNNGIKKSKKYSTTNIRKKWIEIIEK